MKRFGNCYMVENKENFDKYWNDGEERFDNN